MRASGRRENASMCAPGENHSFDAGLWRQIWRRPASMTAQVEGAVWHRQRTRVHGGIPSWHALSFMRVRGGIPPWHALSFMRVRGSRPGMP